MRLRRHLSERVGVRVILRVLGAIVGTFHGLLGLVGLVLYRTGPEHWSMLVMSLSLVSTPAALVLAAWGGRRLAAAWLGCAALAWIVIAGHVYSPWWHAGVFYGPQWIGAILLLRRAAEVRARSREFRIQPATNGGD